MSRRIPALALVALALTALVGCGHGRSKGPTYTFQEVAAALRQHGLAVEVIGPGPETTIIIPTTVPQRWKLTVFSSPAAADKSLAGNPTSPSKITQRGNVVVLPTSTSGSTPPAVVTAIDSLP